MVEWVVEKIITSERKVNKMLLDNNIEKVIQFISYFDDLTNLERNHIFNLIESESTTILIPFFCNTQINLIFGF